jgi:hypothetical protein
MSDDRELHILLVDDDAVDVMGLGVRMMPLVGHPAVQRVIRAAEVVSYPQDSEMGM